LIKAAGTSWRLCRYSELLSVTQTFPSLSSETRALRDKSMARLGAASIRGVPPFGFPEIRSLVGGIFNPTFSASPLGADAGEYLQPV